MNESTPKRRRWWVYLLLVPPLLVIFMLVATILFLRTDYGLERAEGLLNRTLADVGGQNITLNGLHGRFPFDLRLDELRLADAEGPWLELEDLALRWSGRDLLAARLRIHELSATRLEMLRTPIGEQTEREPREPSQGVDLPDAFPRIALEHLAVREIILAEAVAGERIVLQLQAELVADSHEARVDLRLDSMAGPAGKAGQLTLHAEFAQDTNLLTLRADFTDPQGSLAPLLGLPETTPLALLLDGDGPPAAWSGTFHVQAGQLISVESYLALDWQDYPSLSWNGDFFLDSSLLPHPADAYLPRTSFRILAAMPGTQQVELNEVSLRNPLLELILDAHLDLRQSALRGGLQATVRDTAPLGDLTGVELGPEILLHSRFDGPFTAPDIELVLNLTEFAADPARIAELELTSSIQFGQQQWNDRQDIAASGTLQAHGVDVPNTALPAELTSEFDLQYRLGDTFLDLKSLTLRGDGLALQAEGGYALDRNHLEARLDLLPTRIQPWLALHGQDYAGLLDLQITAQGVVQPMDLQLDVQAALEQTSGLPDPLPRLLGERIDLATRISLLSDVDDPSRSGLHRIQADNISLHAEGLDLMADVAYVLDTRELTAQAVLELPDLSLASPDPELDLGGAAVLEVRVHGAVGGNLSLDGDLFSENLQVADLDAFPLRLVLHADALPGSPQGSLSLSASPMQTDLFAETDFALDDNLLRLSGLTLTLPEGTLSGSGDIDLNTQLVTAQLEGRIRDIGPLSALAGQNMAGALDLQLDLQPDGPSQNVQLSLVLDNLLADFGTLSHMSLQAQARDVLGVAGPPHLDASVATQGFQAGENRVDVLEAEAKGTLADIALNAAAQGHALHPFDLRIQATSAEVDARRTIRLQNLTGAWAGQNLVLADPVTITMAGDDLSASPLLLEFGSAIVRAEAQLSGETADLRLGVENLPLHLFTTDVQGALTLGAVLHGPKSALRGDVTLVGNDLSPAVTGLGEIPSLNLQADAVLDGESVTLFAELREKGHTDSLLQAQGQARMRLSLDPVGLDLPRDEPVTASVVGNLDLGWLGDIVLPDSQLLAGLLGLDLQLAGTIDAPEPGGRIQVRRGGYQHLLQGVLIQDIEGDARITEEHFILESLTATDGDQGTLRLEGRADLDPEHNFPFRFTLSGANMNVLDSPQARARLSRISMDVSGTTEAQEVSGQVNLDRVEVFLRDLGGPRVVDLDVVDVHKPRDSAEDAVFTPPIPPLALDIGVHFPSRFFVRGRGLDSEWGGNLHISGNASEPIIRGEIRPQRGRLDLLGKRFTIDEESVIQFTGSQPPRPYVNLIATQTRRDPDGEKTFIVRISGVPPDISPPTLESDPPLPQDEILAQMLFGRSLARISPTQAAQLALAARELAGHGGGLDIMGTARDILLLDDLDVVTGQGGDISLRAGKYINERVYLRLDRDMKTGEETVSADIDLTPRISLESTLGPRGGGLGLFWKRDY
ncbi:translocation/assembly module TamB domain-containing protein [Desulfonatronum thiosulfatophilum]|nr:translocation/assembly module TamB domain-containing protein [Desulfonatronum thiosulfatophilum]